MMKSRDIGLRRFAFLLLFGLLSACGVDDKSHQEQYYGFFESSKGESYKLFRHNAFGFEIDIPTGWQFGVTGTGAEAVILIYSPDVNTRQFTAGYHTLSIGATPFQGVSLDQAYDFFLRGVSQMRGTPDITSGPVRTTLNGATSLSFSYEWQSKTTLTVREDIRLVAAGPKIYSVNVRTIEPITNETWTDYRDAISTFTVL